MRKIAFIIPWYGVDIPGGSEMACRNIAERMAASGREVEVLTTCVKQFNSDWNVNHFSPGNEKINGVLVRRFKVRKRDTRAFDHVNARLMNGEKVSIQEEAIFLQEMVNSTDLERYLADHIEDYQAFVFIPYMFGTTYNGIKHVKDKALLIPAFHDEAYSYFQSFRELYSQVRGLIFFSSPEAEWANKHYSVNNVKQRVLGLGIDHFESDAIRFKQKYGITKPFLLYAGRKDKGKNVHVLLEHFSRYHREHATELELVLIGGGSIDIPGDIRPCVRDLGFVDSQDKYDAYAAAELFCNPSPNESFSIVIMESWLAGRPVLVNSDCEVTKNFCEETNGGLYFSNYEEFAACLELLQSKPDLRRAMGDNGRKYVLENFYWDTVIKRYGEFIDDVSGG